MRLYLDIETIPTQRQDVRDRIAATIAPPSTYKKADTIAAWEVEQKPALIVEAITKTAFDGAFGHVVCIGHAWDSRPAQAAHLEDIKDEKNLISDFYATVSARLDNQSYGLPQVIGHNVVDFDIKFLWQRSFVLGIRVPSWLPRDPKPWGNDVLDTMRAFAGMRSTISMDRLCQAFDMQGKGDIDGSMVADLWLAGEYDKIAEYCRQDVEIVRNIHNRMRVAFGEVNEVRAGADLSRA